MSDPSLLRPPALGTFFADYLSKSIPSVAQHVIDAAAAACSLLGGFLGFVFEPGNVRKMLESQSPAQPYNSSKHIPGCLFFKLHPSVIHITFISTSKLKQQANALE